MKRNKIHDLNSLNLQIDKLEQKKQFIENRIASNWHYLKSDYGAMIRRSIFKDAHLEGRGSFFYWLFKIPEFQNGIGRTAEKLMVKLETLLVKMFDKLAD